jgi:hypothetical protein
MGASRSAEVESGARGYATRTHPQSRSVAVRLGGRVLGLNVPWNGETSAQLAERTVDTQAELARAPIVLRGTLAAVPEAHLSPGGLASSSEVAAVGKSDLLAFVVRGRDGDLTTRLVNAYAGEFTRYSRQLHDAPITAARAQLRKQMDELEAAGQESGALYRQLAAKAVQLEVLAVLQPPNATIVRRAGEAAASRPDATRAALIGLVLGAFVGLGLGLLWDLVAPRARGNP